LLYAPEPTEDGAIHDTLNRFAHLASEYAGAQAGNSGIYPEP